MYKKSKEKKKHREQYFSVSPKLRSKLSKPNLQLLVNEHFLNQVCTRAQPFYTTVVK